MEYHVSIIMFAILVLVIHCAAQRICSLRIWLKCGSVITLPTCHALKRYFDTQLLYVLEHCNCGCLTVHKNHIHLSSRSHQQWRNVTVSLYSEAFSCICMHVIACMEMRIRHSPTLMSLCASASQGRLPYLTDV